MTYCPECGSNVAELDIFCPNCGISIKPASVAADSVLDEMASTIVMMPTPKPGQEEPVSATPAIKAPESALPIADVAEESPLITAVVKPSIPPPPTPHLLDVTETAELQLPAAAPEIESPVADENSDAIAAEKPAADAPTPDEANIPANPEAAIGDNVHDTIEIVGLAPNVEELIAPRSAELTQMQKSPRVASEPVQELAPAPETGKVYSVFEDFPDAEPESSAAPEPVESSSITAEPLDLEAELPVTLEMVAGVELLSGALPEEHVETEAEEVTSVATADADSEIPETSASAFDELQPGSEEEIPTPILLETEADTESAAPEKDIGVSELSGNEINVIESPGLEAVETLLGERSDEELIPETPDESTDKFEPEDISPPEEPESHAAVGEESVSEPVPDADDQMSELFSDAYVGAEPIGEIKSVDVSAAVSELPDKGFDEEPIAVTPAVITAEPLESEFGLPLEQSSSGRVISDSGTTPNIGTGTTDGRKSGLKPLSEGTMLIGRYRIVKKIGGGGMGAVYLAFDQNLGGTQRAVKEMVQSHIEEEQQAKAVEDFKRESMILSTLDHPSIPTIYDYFYDEAESRFYLVMKYISGGDLASTLRSTPEGRIDEGTVTEWALQIIDVLDYLHSLPTTIVYRDLKPSNVMIDGKTGRIMLIDFGIARSINQNLEKGVTAVGTMGYAPPELFSGQVEPRSDIYSLGSTMFHLLTGADPQNNPLLIFDFQKNPRPRQINPRLSDQIEKILMRAVEYSADARFASAAEMHRVLQEHLDNLRSGNVSYGITETPAAVSLAFQMVFCGFCGQRIVATDLFCAFCGSKQPIAQQGVHSEIYAHGNVTARLVIEGTSDLSAPSYSLEKSENLVGRRDPMSNIFPEVDLSKYDPQTKISRRHARIWRDGSSFNVEDLGSSNGTVLLSRVSDTLRLTPHQPHPLANGDRLKIGDTTLQFIVG